jgi:hypothetical protein
MEGEREGGWALLVDGGLGGRWEGGRRGKGVRGGETRVSGGRRKRRGVEGAGQRGGAGAHGVGCWVGAWVGGSSGDTGKAEECGDWGTRLDGFFEELLEHARAVDAGLGQPELRHKLYTDGALRVREVRWVGEVGERERERGKGRPPPPRGRAQTRTLYGSCPEGEG